MARPQSGGPATAPRSGGWRRSTSTSTPAGRNGLLVHTGLFGTKSSFAPLAGARADGEDVRIGYSKQEVKDAPSVEADGELSQEEEARLYAHYGLDYSESRSDTGRAAATGRRSGAT